MGGFVPFSSFDEKAAHLWAVENDPKVGVGNGGGNEGEAVGRGDRQSDNEHYRSDRAWSLFRELSFFLILTGWRPIGKRTSTARNTSSVA